MGNVEVSVYDVAAETVQHTVLHEHFQQDDHDDAAFLPVADGRLLAVYTRHGVDRHVYYRFSEPHDPTRWSAAQVFDAPAAKRNTQRLTGVNVTYSNLFRLASGRIVNFFCGLGQGPNYMYSDDRSRMSTSSARCRSALNVSLEDQSMLRTVATQRPRISRAIAGSGAGATDGRTHPAATSNTPGREKYRNGSTA